MKNKRKMMLALNTILQLIHFIGASLLLSEEKFSKKNGVREEESSWYWDPPSQTSKAIDHEVETQYKIQLRALQEELSAIKERNERSPEVNDELTRLKEENANLITNLEDLDNQHRLAMEKLLTLKTDLQKNFEVLKREHGELKIANDQYSREVQNLVEKINERDKEIARLKPFCSDYDTLAHKYQNLERVHSLLRDNAEKFQEENQDLHEEIFKLQEQVTKLEHDLELAILQTEASNTVPKEKYDELFREFQRLKESKCSSHSGLDEINVDDNAKVVIETLKKEIGDLKYKLSTLENNNHDRTDNKIIKADKIIQLYNKYINFDLPIDYVGKIPSSNNNVVLFKLESVFKTISSFKKEIDTLELKVSEKNNNITDLLKQIDDITTENDFLTTDIQHFERELDEMKKNNDFLISEIAALKNSSKLEPIIETHEDNYTKLESELADCNRINKTFESEIKRIEKELADVKSEKVQLQDSLHDLKQKYTSMLNELELCKTQTKNVIELENNSNVENNENQQKILEENDLLKKKLNTLSVRNEQLAIDVQITQNDKVLLSKEIDDLKNIIQTKLEEFKNLELENVNLKTSNKELHRRLEETIRINQENHERRVAFSENSEAKTDDSKNSESSATSERFRDALLENSTLKHKIEELNNAILSLKNSFTELSTENQTLKNEVSALIQKTVSLEKTIQDNKDKVAQVDVLNKNVTALKEENKRLLHTKDKLEAELFSSNNKVVNLEEELVKLVTDLNDKDITIDKIHENNLTLQNLQNQLDLKHRELEALNEKYEKVSEEFNKTSDLLNRSQDELSSIHTKKEEIDKQLFVLSDELSNKNAAIATLTNRVEELEKSINDYKSIIKNKDKEIKELNQSFVELTDKMKTNNTHQNEEYAKLVEEISSFGKTTFDLNNQLEIKHKEITDLEQKIEQFEKAYIEYQNIIEQSQTEKANLINLVNLKHNESLQYHNEIQRLNHVILEQTEEFKKTIEEKDLLIQNKINCTTCDAMKAAVEEKDKTISDLNKKIIDFDKLQAELVNAGETIRNLTKRCEDLDKSLSIQLETVKQLNAEKVQLSEQEQNSSRELERLRKHLLEMEENYTQELMSSEQKLSECQVRLHQVEEKAKQTSTVYTSNSIRANQEVETLRNQIKLLEKQREEVQSRLSEAEDFKSKSEASLTNLQIVLEQFQLEKERDIAAATEKVRNKLEEIKNENSKLKHEITRLNSKLEEALAGLQAASRLGDQVETKAAQINDLKEQVRTLQTSVAAAEERYYNAISNQQDKVDKNLVKNLLINYVVASAQSVMNKTQVLRILSTVLDFNQQECEKLGLVRSTTTTDSLAAEFVKFLQNESKPRPQLPNVVALGQSRSTTPSSRRSSTMGPNPILEPGHRRNPSTGSNNVLFQNLDSDSASQKSTESEPRVIALSHMETGVTQTRNNESAILKHVLKDM